MGCEVLEPNTAERLRDTERSAHRENQRGMPEPDSSSDSARIEGSSDDGVEVSQEGPCEDVSNPPADCIHAVHRTDEPKVLHELADGSEVEDSDDEPTDTEAVLSEPPDLKGREIDKFSGEEGDPGNASEGPSSDQEAEHDVAPAEEDLPEEVKREMLASICKGAVALTRVSHVPSGYCNVYLVGTAHVSEESCREVRDAIRLLKPQVVFVELCEKRRFMLGSAQLRVPTAKEMLSTWRERRMNLMGILYSWFLAKVAAKMEVFPGQEFRVAYEEARACGAKVLLGDRDVQVTLKRTWEKMSFWHKTKFIFCTIFQAISLPSMENLKDMIEELQDNDVLTLAFQELSKSFPTLIETLVYERDMFMAAVLQRVAEHHSSIVAVVGKGHIPGITKHWDTEVSIHELDKFPSKKSSWMGSWKVYIVIGVVISLPVFLSYTSWNQDSRAWISASN